jgi:D-serine deaminase-like pyridoxal phosphate-dependent protein
MGSAVEPAAQRVSTRFDALQEADYALPADVAGNVLSPALVVHMDKVRSNLRTVIEHCGGADRWRPHVKTTKIPAVFAEVARAGVRHFKCATTREAALLCDALRREGTLGGDSLLAYPLVGPALTRLGRIAQEFPETQLSVLCEEPARVAHVAEELGVFVDVNPGMNRTGIPVADHSSILAVVRAAGASFRGVHFYDGHLHKGAADERRRAAFACYEQLLELLAVLKADGHDVSEVITSGTPTFLHALAFEAFGAAECPKHRVSPGTVVYHDLRTEQENIELDLAPAATVFTRVVSHPRDGLATCDAGSKSIAAEAGDPCAFVIGHPELVAQPPNEEHLPLHVTSGKRPARGAHLHLVPMHVCPTVNLAEQAILLDAGEVQDVVPVSARAHELLLDA